jgi:hypothetical protein
LNWNPSYSYATPPEGLKDMPDYWKALTERVPPEKGLPHFRNVRISDIKATGARRAIAAAAYVDAPLENFKFKDLEIEAQTAGSIQDAVNWSFVNTLIKTADGSRVTVKDSRGVTGLAEN